MTDYEQGFRDAVRRIDVMDAPGAGIDAADVAARGEALRRRRIRVRTSLVAGVAALVATGVGLAGLLSGLGQTAPVAGVPVEPQPSGPVVVDLPSVAPMPGTEVVVDDPDIRGGASQRAVFVDGSTVYLADPVADEIRVYRDARLVQTLRTPSSVEILDLAVRDDVWYVIARLPHDGSVRALGTLTRNGDGLVATDDLPSGLVNAEPVALVRLADDLAVVDALGDYALLAGAGPLPDPPTITSDQYGRVQLRDGQIDAALRTRPGRTVVSVLARDTTHAWYEVATTADDGTIADVVYQFALTGQLVATWSGGPATTTAGVHDYVVDGGQVYQLVDTEAGVQVVRLQPRQV